MRDPRPLLLLAVLGVLGAACDDDAGGSQDAHTPLPDSAGDRNTAEVLAPEDAATEAPGFDAGDDDAAGVLPDAGAPEDGGSDLPPAAPEEPASEDPVCPTTPCKVRSVGLGFNRACTVTEDGQARCWGSSATATRLPPGKYRDVFPMSRSHTLALSDSGRLLYLGGAAPLILPLDDRLTSFVTSGGDGCGLRADRTIACWDLSRKLTFIPPADPVKSLHRSGSGTCALRDDGAALWFPDLGAPQPGPFTQVGCGLGFACGIRPDDTLACWTPTGDAVPTPAGRYRKVQPARTTLCVLALDGGISCWDPLATDGKKDPVSPVAGSFVDLHHQASNDTNKVGCGVLGDGSWRCWGESVGGYGETSRPEDDDYVLLGDACALTRTGVLDCWRAFSPQFPLGTAAFVELDEGTGWGCALTASGVPQCFDHWRAPRALPVAPPGQAYRHLRVERAPEMLGACALRKDTHVLECWPARPRPGLPSGPLKTFALAEDGSGGCAIRDDGGGDGGPLACWSATGLSPVVTEAPAGRRFKAVAFGSLDSVCALDVAGELACWGMYAPFGVPRGPFTALAGGLTDWTALRADGTLAKVSRETGVPALPRLRTGKFVSLARNGYCALTDTGRAKCWGHMRR